ncbi:MAG: 1-acyl-sn-glycerol-3-phosphate acyltransferase [Betaproteobacteria bacterium]|nr:1-acyl-sn-glycerol-3-phosphate acyltransferase [Betaproteobacteria bacterium]
MTLAAPLPLRLVRIARLVGHLFRGLAIAAFRYGRMDEAARRAATRRWSLAALTSLGVTVHIEGPPAAAPADALPARCLLVANHISWLDILVLLSVCPAIFVAKSEIRGWPLVGWLCARVGTLFIQRGRRRSARHTSKVMADAIARGALVSIFPEGTTTDGLSLARFHAALFQPAADAGAMVQPVALRYAHRSGHYCAAPNYVGDTSFLSSLWSTTAARHMVARLSFLVPLEAAGRDRRDIARSAEAAIAAKLGVGVASGIPAAATTPAHRKHGRHTPPGTGDGPRGGSR